MNEFFAKTAKSVSAAVGSPFAFVIAAGSVVLWAVSGPFFGYSQNWQLVINTGTTIVTFLMVFVIQNAANRDQKALQLKLDELLRATRGAETGFVNLENLDDATLKDLERKFKEMHREHAEHTTDDHEGESAQQTPRTSLDEGRRVLVPAVALAPQMSDGLGVSVREHWAPRQDRHWVVGVWGPFARRSAARH